MSTNAHTVTTTAFTASGLVPICHCGWHPTSALHTEQDVEFALLEHNNGFALSACPLCHGDLVAVPARMSVDDTTVHFDDKQCTACGWQASHAPE